MIKTIAIAISLLIFASISNAEESAKVGEKAPDFTLMSHDGNKHSLSDFAGKKVVLEWINYDCPFVVKHYSTKNMQNLQKEYTDKGVVWLTICSSAPGKQGHFDVAEISKRMKELKSANTAYLIDESGDVGRKYNARTTPNMFVISEDGTLQYAGAIDSKSTANPDDVNDADNYVKMALDALFSGKEVITKSTKPYGCSVKYADK